MAGLSLTITDAGRAALVNAQNTGTVALTIAAIGVSATHTAGALTGRTTLPGELKRLGTFAGDVVAADTLHLTIRDETADAYSLRAFGLYLSDGTLFALYSQSAVILEKSASAMLLLATDVALKSLTTANIAFGATNWLNPPATTTVQGVVELATTAETQAGADPQRAVTPLGLKATLQQWAANFAAAVHGHAITDVVGLDTALAGKAANNHAHAASAITSGIFEIARIPDLAISKITGLLAALQDKAASIHQHDAADVATGILSALRIPNLAMDKITGLVTALVMKADLAGAEFIGVVRVKRAATAGSVEISSSSSQYRPGLVSFHTPDGTRRGYIGYAASDVGGQLLIQGENGWSWKFSVRPAFGDATPWDSDNFDPSPSSNFVANDSAAWTRHQTPYGYIDFGPANANYAHIYTDRPGFYFNAPLLVNGREAYHAGNFNPTNFIGGTINGGSTGISIAGSGGLSVGGSGGLTVAGSGGIKTTTLSASAPSIVETAGNVSGGSWAGAVGFTISSFHPTLAFNDRSTGQNHAAIAYDGGTFTFRYDADGSGRYATEGAILSVITPTAPVGNNSLRLATTAFVQQELTAHDAAILDMCWPAGQLHLIAKASPPTNSRLLIAEGQAVSRTTYARLFAEIGTVFGAGNGTTTFNLPDWRGVFFRGLDRNRGLDPNRALGVYQASQNLRHNHSLPSRSNANSGSLYVEDADATGTISFPLTGDEGGDEARPVNQALLACISY